MLSLLNKGYYISPSKVEPKKTFVDPYKQEQLKNIVQSGKYINRYHFDCIFRGSGVNNPFPNRRSGGSSRGASVLQSFSQHQNPSTNTKNSLSLNYSLQQQDILSTPQKTESTRQNIPQASPEGQYFEYEEEEEENYYQQVPQSGGFQSHYDEPMALKAPMVSMVSEAKDFLEQDSAERRRLTYIEQGGPKVKYNGSSRLHNSVASGFSAGSVHHEDVNKMSPIRREFEIAREYNNAASVIQRAWRGYLESKREEQRLSTQQAQQSNYISFGGERGDSDYIGTSESENLVETIRNPSERAINDSSYNHREQHSRHYYPPELPITEESAGSGRYRYTTDGSEVYDQAIERLSTLRSLIERDYPRMQGIQKRIEDVKYYFDLGYYLMGKRRITLFDRQNLIDEYTRREPFSSEIYDLILAYNEYLGVLQRIFSTKNRTFRNAHNELDQISSELTTELGHLGERTSADYQREPPRGAYGGRENDYLKPIFERERNRYESRKTSGLDIVRELWGYMRDMSENLLACQDQHRQTDDRVKKLERENFSYKNLYMNFKEKEKLRESQREFEENIRMTMTEPQITEVTETERNTQPDYMGNLKSSDRDSDIDRQLEAEMLRSQGLKKDLINVLETYDQVSSQRKSRNSVGRNSAHSSVKNHSSVKKSPPVETGGYQKSRESRDHRDHQGQSDQRDPREREYSYQNDSRNSFGPANPSRHSFGPKNSPAQYQESRNEMIEYYETEGSQEGWRDVHNNELHNVMNYYNDGNNSTKSREIYIQEAPEIYEQSPIRQEYVIKRPSRSSLQNSRHQSITNFPGEPQFDSSRLQQKANQIEDPSNVKTSPRFGEDQMNAHQQAMAMKKWPNINQMKRELEASLDREDMILEVSSEGKYYKPVKPNLSWKKTP